jgi:hypothetical protein
LDLIEGLVSNNVFDFALSNNPAVDKRNPKESEDLHLRRRLEGEDAE